MIRSGAIARNGTVRSICTEVSSVRSAPRESPTHDPSSSPSPPPRMNPITHRVTLARTCFASVPLRASSQSVVTTAEGGGSRYGLIAPDTDARCQIRISTAGRMKPTSP